VIMKTALRTETKFKLKGLCSTYIENESNKVLERLISIEEYKNSHGLSVYLSMNGEVNTLPIISHAFSCSKRVAIPKILGKKSEDMFMLELCDATQITTFPKNNWGIAEPPMDLINQSQDCTYLGIIDLILVPGCAFDSSCGRLGHGKGYYDCFIERVFHSNAQLGKPLPTLIGLSLDEQIMSDDVTIPMESHDRYMDYIVTPSRLISRTHT